MNLNKETCILRNWSFRRVTEFFLKTVEVRRIQKMGRDGRLEELLYEK
jgi:hypothetical protein